MQRRLRCSARGDAASTCLLGGASHPAGRACVATAALDLNASACWVRISDGRRQQPAAAALLPGVGSKQGKIPLKAKEEREQAGEETFSDDDGEAELHCRDTARLLQLACGTARHEGGRQQPATTALGGSRLCCCSWSRSAAAAGLAMDMAWLTGPPLAGVLLLAAELRAACHRERKSGKAPPPRLTGTQKAVVAALIAKHGQDVEVGC